MANRYNNFQVTDSNFNAFELDYDMMKEPILAQQLRYDQTQAAVDKNITDLAATQVRPEDQDILQSRVDALIADEKALRDQAGGDLNNPIYQQEVRDRFRKEGNDNFYRTALWNKTELGKREEAEIKFRDQYGKAPSDWQDAGSDFVNSYLNSDQSGAYTFKGFTKQIPFTPIAMEFLEPKIKAKLLQEGYSFQTDKEGRSYLASSSKQKVTATDLRKILELNTEIMTGTSVEQMEMDYHEKLRKGFLDPQRYPSFTDYLDETVQSIVDNLAYSWRSDKYIKHIDPLEPVAAVTKKGRNAAQVRKDWIEDLNKGNKLNVSSAVPVIGVPDVVTARTLHTSNTVQMDVMENEGLNTLKSILQVGEDNTNQLAVGLKSVVNMGENGYSNPQLMYSYYDPKGNLKEIDLTSREAMARIYEMPISNEQAYEALAQAKLWDSQYNALLSDNIQLEEFDNRAGNKAFNTEENSDAYDDIKNKGFYRAYLDDKGRAEIDKITDSSVVNQVLDQGVFPTKRRSFGTTGVNTSSSSGKIAKASTYIKLAEALGIPTGAAGAIGDDLDEDLKFRIEQTVRDLSDEEKEAVKWTLREDAAKEYLLDKGDQRYKEYSKYYTDRWEEGLTYALKDKSPEPGNEEGIRQRVKTIYDVNLTNSTGSESGAQFKKDQTILLQSLVGTLHPGDKDQNATYGALPLYRHDNDELVTDDDRIKVIGENMTVQGYTFDDQGVAIVIQSQLDPDNKTPGGIRYEIRNQKLVFDYMAKSGLQHHVMLNTADDIVRAFQDESGEWDRGRLKPGQTRGKTSTVVELGEYSFPVYRAHTDMKMYGQDLKEGEFMMYSESDGEFKVFNDPLQITIEGLRDKVTQHDVAMESVAFGAIGFDGEVEISPTILAEGEDVLSREMYDQVNKLSTLAPANVPLNMRDAHRGTYNQQRINNPKTPHAKGDATDFRVIDQTTGKVDENIVKFFSEQASLKNGYTYKLEFKDINDPEFKYYKKKYPNLVDHNPLATGLHIHVQYDRNVIISETQE